MSECKYKYKFKFYFFIIMSSVNAYYKIKCRNCFLKQNFESTNKQYCATYTFVSIKVSIKTLKY